MAGGADARETRPVVSEFQDVAELGDVYFEFDRYDVRPADVDRLEANARWLVQHPGHLVLIEGHTDERGTPSYNMALGQQRAAAVRSYLIARGVRAGTLTLISYGADRPQCREANEACWARNRRAHFRAKPQ